MNESSKTHYFPAQSLKVITERDSASEYVAMVADDPYTLTGRGKSRIEAIVELRELLRQAGQIE